MLCLEEAITREPNEETFGAIRGTNQHNPHDISSSGI